MLNALWLVNGCLRDNLERVEALFVNYKIHGSKLSAPNLDARVCVQKLLFLLFLLDDSRRFGFFFVDLIALSRKQPLCGSAIRKLLPIFLFLRTLCCLPFLQLYSLLHFKRLEFARVCLQNLLACLLAYDLFRAVKLLRLICLHTEVILSFVLVCELPPTSKLTGGELRA